MSGLELGNRNRVPGIERRSAGLEEEASATAGQYQMGDSGSARVTTLRGRSESFGVEGENEVDLLVPVEVLEETGAAGGAELGGLGWVAG